MYQDGLQFVDNVKHMNEVFQHFFLSAYTFRLMVCNVTETYNCVELGIGMFMGHSLFTGRVHLMSL